MRTVCIVAALCLLGCIAQGAVAQQKGCGTYKIKAGDTFWKLSVDRGVDLQAILDANPGVVPEKLRIGQTVNLPCADGASGDAPSAPAAEADSAPAPAPKGSDKGAEKGSGKSQRGGAYKQAPTSPRRALAQAKSCGTYTVKSGDTLTKISEDKGLDLQDVLDANPRVKPDFIQVGRKINLPCVAGSGESPSAMATAPAAEQEATPAPKSSNMGSDKSSDKGAAAEKGTGNSQSPAYKPAPAGPRRSLTQDCGKYKIKAGDTFWKLSVDRGLDLQAILDANPRVVPERLQIGQTINLPCADGNAGDSSNASAPGTNMDTTPAPRGL